MVDTIFSYALTFLVGIIAGLLIAAHRIIAHEPEDEHARLWQIFWRAARFAKTEQTKETP